MKLSSLTLALSLVLASAVCGFSADKSTAKSKPAKPAKVVKAKKTSAKSRNTEQVALTGSYIKRDIHRNGIVTDGPNAVVVLDSEAIGNSGAADLRQLLVLRGLSR